MRFMAVSNYQMWPVQFPVHVSFYQISLNPNVELEDTLQKMESVSCFGRTVLRLVSSSAQKFVIFRLNPKRLKFLCKQKNKKTMVELAY